MSETYKVAEYEDLELVKGTDWNGETLVDLASRMAVRERLPITTGKNLFNKDTAYDGYYINEIYGSRHQNASYFASDYIPVSAGMQLAFSYTDGEVRIAFYTSDKTFISGIKVNSNPVTIPVNCFNIRFSAPIAQKNIFTLSEGIFAIPFEPFKYGIPQNNLIGYQGLDTITNSGVQHGDFDALTVGKNLFSMTDTSDTCMVNPSTGYLLTGGSYSNYRTSDYIKVKPGAKYVASHTIRSYALYSPSKAFVSGGDLIYSGSIIEIPTSHDYYYIRFSCDRQLTKVQFEEGEALTVYEDFGIKFVYGWAEKKLAELFPDSSDILLFLPDEICIAVGRTIELYNNQVVISQNLPTYSIVWTCSVGSNLKRKWSCTGTSGTIGTYSLKCDVYKEGGVLIATKSTTVKIVDSVITEPFTILPIGDSLTNNKAWLGETRTLANNKLTFVGTRGSAPLNHEGRSGFSAASYLTDTVYSYESEGIHPFWDATEGRFSWNYYKTNTEINPDAVQIYLGTNGMTLDPTVNAGNIKQIVDYIRQDDAALPIFVIFTLYRGNQDGIKSSGVWKNLEDRKVFNLMKRLHELLHEYSNLFFIPISLTHDSEFNFGAVETPLNPRASQVEYLPVEATHPQTQGYFQMADIMFSTITAHQVWVV